jgi:hypothetical protein
MRKSMNYNEFMKAVDKKLSVMSETEKAKWIHDRARTTKEHERIKFINSLDEKQNNNLVISEKKWIEEWCRKVENEEIYFECSGYEEYGESYWDSDDIFEIGKDLLRAFQVAEDLADKLEVWLSKTIKKGYSKSFISLAGSKALFVECIIVKTENLIFLRK